MVSGELFLNGLLAILKKKSKIEINGSFSEAE